MERFVEKQHKEFIRMTIQRQEQTFKHQVQELHRLYSVQKSLMNELKQNAKQNRNWTNSQPNRTSQSIDFSHDNSKINLFADQIPTESSRSFPGNNFMKSRQDIIDTEERDLELSLSIGLSSSPSSKSCKRRIYQERDSSVSSRSDMSSSNTASDQEKNRPRWLFQGLSINRS